MKRAIADYEVLVRAWAKHFGASISKGGATNELTPRTLFYITLPTGMVGQMGEGDFLFTDFQWPRAYQWLTTQVVKIVKPQVVGEVPS